MATKRITCPLAFWFDEKGRKKRHKHTCDRTCSMTQAECMDIARTQGFYFPHLGRRIVSQYVPSGKCERPECFATPRAGLPFFNGYCSSECREQVAA